MLSDEIFMHRCFQLALLGAGHVVPNPLVGCVITHNNRIIGEGFHQSYGNAHAEVNAIASVEDPSLLKEATVYVNLEPCSHFGKTPPCADLLIEKQVRRVIICNQDPNPKVSGRGIAKLKDAGIEVKTHVLKEKGEWLNRRFFTWIEKKRPYIILKWAQTANGFIDIDRPEGVSPKNYWITNDALRILSHKWRAEEAAILIGYNTALNDNPQLNIRHYIGKNPVRIVIDPKHQLPKNLNVFDDTQTTLWCDNDLQSLTTLANEHNLQSIIIEGGKKTLSLFIKNNYWDEARILIGQKYFPTGLTAPSLKGVPFQTTSFGEDEVRFFKNNAL